MKKKTAPILTAFIFLVIVVLVIIAGALIKKYKPSEERVNLNKYFGVEQDNQVALVMPDEVVQNAGILIDGEPYISYENVTEHLNGRFYWDYNENVLLYTLPNDVVTAQIGSKDYFISKQKNSKSYDIVKAEGTKTYVALDYIQEFTNLKYKVEKKPGRVVITNNWGEVKTKTVKRDTQVRTKAGIKSPIISDVSKDSKVGVLDEMDKWSKVRTADGFIGYVKNSKMTEVQKETISRDFEEPEFTNISKDGTINMAWHQVTNNSANNAILQTIANTKGLTTISPTWWSIKDNDGNISSLASGQYVNYAHQSGIEVWALVDNFNKNVSTNQVLSYTSKREQLVNQLIAEAIQYNIDGINVDFEEIDKDTAPHYIQFIRELSVKCRKNGIILSVDNYAPYDFNAHYNRKEQGVFADYIVIMGYDEHYSGSKEAGSVASYNFVKNGIKNTLKEVPAKKVINAIPFFTRLWKEVPKTQGELDAQAGTEDANYTSNVTSEALGMDAAKAKLDAAGVTPVWDDKTKQYFGQYDQGGATYKVWLEEETSIKEKLKLIKQYKLAGVAEWKLGFEKSAIWDTILKYVN